MREALDLEKREDAAPLFREVAEELSERDPFCVVDAGDASLERHLLDRRLLRSSLAPPQCVVAGVDEDAVHPGAERCLAGVAPGRTVDLQLRLLHRVFRVADVAEVVESDRFHPFTVRPIDPLECRRVARGACGGQTTVLVCWCRLRRHPQTRAADGTE